MPEPVAPQPRIAKPDHAGLLDRTFTRLRHMASAIFAAPAQNPAVMKRPMPIIRDCATWPLRPRV